MSIFDWSEMVFSEAFEINPRYRLIKGEKYPYIEMAAVGENTGIISSIVNREYSGGGAKFSDGDTIFARITPCLENGKIAQVNLLDGEVGFGSTEFIVIRGRDGLTDNKFAYYMSISLTVRDFAIQRMTGTSGRQRVPVQVFDNLIVPIPPLPEQRAIAEILGSLDDKIEANRRENETLEATARAIFKSWFVDFDPVHAKARGVHPAGMDAETSALFPDSFEDSASGLIPRGWRVGTLGDIAKFNTWTLGKNDRLDYIEYVEISEVMRGEIGTIKTFVRGEEPSRARRRLRHGDTVISTVRPDRGAYFLCLNPSPLLIASTGFGVFTPTSNCWSFLHAALIRPEIFERLGALADGAAYPAVAPEMIAALPIVIPSSEIMTVFHEIVASLYEKANQNRIESRTLAETRDALLPRLVSGELRVSQTPVHERDALVSELFSPNSLEKIRSRTDFQRLNKPDGQQGQRKHAKRRIYDVSHMRMHVAKGKNRSIGK